MRFAIIDTGTNTFHMLIAEQKENDFEIIYKSKESVKLGESGITSNVISEEPYQRGINVFKEFKQQCEIHGAEKIFAIGTSALRNATNTNEFIEKVKNETGIDMIIVSGNLEAELIWNGVRHSMDMGSDTSLIMDIGGGSVEFIFANKDEIFCKRSFDIGGALLLEKFKPSDPITPGDILKLEEYFDAMLKVLPQASNIFNAVQLIGSSGSFDTFSEMIAHQFHTIDVLNNVTEFNIKPEEYKAIHQQLITSTHAERLEMKGMLAMRADMIVVASILLTYVLRVTKIKQVKSSAFALKEGIMYKLNELAHTIEH